MIKTIDNISYKTVPENKELSCDGCAAFENDISDDHLCNQLASSDSCLSDRIIWIKLAEHSVSKKSNYEIAMSVLNEYLASGTRLEYAAWLESQIKVNDEEYGEYLRLKEKFE